MSAKYLMSFAHLHFFLLVWLLCCPSVGYGSMPTWVGVEIDSFAQTAGHPNIVYATGGAGLFKSADRGISWEPVKIPQTPSGNRKIFADPENHEHLLLWILWSDEKSYPGYQESFDGGKTWVWKPFKNFSGWKKEDADILKITDFSMDSAKNGGAWWAVVGKYLLRSADRGENWKINTENVQKHLFILHLDKKTLRLSENTLFQSSDRGETWQVIYVFPDGPKETRRYATDFLRLASGELLVRVNGIWYRSADEGNNFSEERGGLSTLPGEKYSKNDEVERHFSSRWYCRLRQAGEFSDNLLAFCGWDNGHLPSYLCLHGSRDGGKTWSPMLGDGLENCQKGLPSWSPIALWVDRANPNVLIVSWMAGGVYRSEDGGTLWSASDQGLRFHKRDEKGIFFIAVNEPPLIQAVLKGDQSAVDQLLSKGVNVNMPGNYISGVLEANFIVKGRLYDYLRSKGAAIPLGKETKLFTRACSKKQTSMIYDFIDAGYDWASPGQKDEYGRLANTDFYECLRNLNSDEEETKKDFIKTLIDRYIKSKKYPSVDETILDLFEMDRPDLAKKLIKAASRNKFLDAQSTPPSPRRHKIFYQALSAGEYELAKKIYLFFVKENLSLYPEEFSSDVPCVIKIREWYYKHGLKKSYGYCLSDEKLSLKTKKKMLALDDSRNMVSFLQWDYLADDSDTAWVKETAEYKKFMQKKEKMTGIVGVKPNYQTVDKLNMTGKMLIEEVIEGYPAAEAGLQKNDEILAVDGVIPTEANHIDLIYTGIRGVPGTSVKLKVRQAGEEKELILIRRKEAQEPTPEKSNCAEPEKTPCSP